MKKTVEDMRAALLAHVDEIHKGDMAYSFDDREDYVDYLESLDSYEKLMHEATDIIKYYSEYLGDDTEEDHPNIDAIEATIAWIMKWSIEEVAA